MLNSQVSLDLMLTDAVNVNAFDVIVEYDDALLRLDGWANGGFLSNLAVVVKTDNPGYFRLFCTQLATPPVSGNGSLIRLTFSGLALGNSDIAITKGELADSQGQKTDPTLEGGRVSVVATTVPSLTPTATHTQPPPHSTPPDTPTPTA
ncbi:MAG: cohesin domain-containing protein, partial [Anaerolineaceae bacterium]|nr:cohesin domain-containing protein [Anaerolineaceae bacterium]